MSNRTPLALLLLRVVPTIFVVAFAIFAQYHGVADSIDRRFQDTLVRLATNVPNGQSAEFADTDGGNDPSAPPDVAVISIDPRSLRSFNDWPWPRSRHAQAIDRLAAAGARAVAFDIDFSSPSDPLEDALFAEAIQRHGAVVLASFSQVQTVGDRAELEIANTPIEELRNSAAGLGSVLVPIDPDGVVRHVPRASTIRGEAVPSLARAALDVALRSAGSTPKPEIPSASESTWVDFRRVQPEIPMHSYVDLLEGRIEPRLLEDRVIFIGATAAEFQDLWATPVAPAFPGVLIQAVAYRTAVAERMGEPVISPAPLPWIFGGYFALGLLLFPRSGMNRYLRLGLFIATSLALIGLAWGALAQLGILAPTAIAFMLVASQYALGIESLQKRIEERAAAQESSLSVLARLGEPTTVDCSDSSAVDQRSKTQGLELALELLGEVVAARGAVLMSASPTGRLTEERLEWRPPRSDGEDLVVDMDVAEAALAKRKLEEVVDPSSSRAPVVYTPLVAGADPVGVLVVFCNRAKTIDALTRRTIATVGAQMALTAQNLRLIDKLRQTFESSIAAVAGAVEARDGYTDQHCRRLAAFSSLMGTRLGMPEEEIRSMELGALLHDVGKIGIPDSILNKPGRLSDGERAEMQRHPEIGAGIVAPVVGLEKTTLDCVIHHHERWDGGGYPEGLEGDEIPLAARIVAIVDVWDALSTQRPYKKAFSQEEVRDLMNKGRGTQFDPDLTELFFEILDEQGDEMLALIARSSAAGAVA